MAAASAETVRRAVLEMDSLVGFARGKAKAAKDHAYASQDDYGRRVLLDLSNDFADLAYKLEAASLTLGGP